MNSSYQRRAVAVRSMTAIFWLGFFMAISFMEAPLKFTAPGLSMTEGLQIGKIVFKALNICEWIFLLVIFITCMVKKTARRGFYLITVISIIMTIETGWLLPILDQHAELIIRGGQVIDHHTHWFYVILEVVKVPVLLFIGIEGGTMLWREKTPI
ncbi:MAG TPA: hypothetical protein VNW51_09485 [Mucilaginibacter sp.]|jgi:hypothetical protein|nr:hypothetical protein [Mucilaginibacter sp.]